MEESSGGTGENEKSAGGDEVPSANETTDNQISIVNANPFARSSLIGRSPGKSTSSSLFTSPADDMKSSSLNLVSDNKPGGVARCAYQMMRREKASPIADLSVATTNIVNGDENHSSATSGTPKRNANSPLQPADAKKSKSKSTLDELEAAIAKLQRQIDAQPTIKREIKTTMKELKMVFACHRLEQVQKMAEEKEQSVKGRQDEIVDFRSGMSTCMSVESITSYANKPWPVAAFQNTSFRQEKADEKKIISMIVFPSELKTDMNYSRLANQLPPLKLVTADNFIAEETMKIVRHERIQMPGVAAEEVAKTYIIKAALLSQPPVLDVVDCVKWGATLREEAAAEGVKVIEVGLPKGVDVARTRKILECCFFGTDIKICLKLSRGQRNSQAVRTRQSAGVIITPGENKSFSDVVKEMKNAITPGEVGVEVRGIRRTKSGAVHLQLSEKKEGGRQNFLNSVAKITTAKSVATVQKWKGVVIMDVEEDAERDAIISNIMKELSIPREEVRLNEFRPCKWGNKMVTAYLPVKAADELIEMGRLMTDWAVYKVKEKIEPDFCSKCQRFGHGVRFCKEKNARDKICLKCGTDAHETRDCNAAEHCFMCDEDGHRANSLKCKVYRSLIEEKRTRNSNGAH